MEDYCVICGNIVPEGLQVCPICEIKNGIKKDENAEMRMLLESSCISDRQMIVKRVQAEHVRIENWHTWIHRSIDRSFRDRDR